MDNRPTAPKNLTCHYTGHKKKCADLCGNCWLWMKIPVRNDDAEWMCGDLAAKKMQFDANGEINGQGRAIEGLRNVFFEALPADKQKRLLDNASDTDPRGQ